MGNVTRKLQQEERNLKDFLHYLQSMSPNIINFHLTSQISNYDQNTTTAHENTSANSRGQLFGKFQ